MSILPGDWNPKQEADKVLPQLINVCSPVVKGAHDSDFILVGNKAYIVYMANDIKPSENPRWAYVYTALSIVDIETNSIDTVITFAASEMVFENEKLPVGSCFVPRILQINEHTLRCFFASENPGVRESQTWFIDFDTESLIFDSNIYRAKLITSLGLTNMQPKYFHQHAVSEGFKRERQDYGLYPIDSFKEIEGHIYAVLNNFATGQNALAILRDDMCTFEVLGSYNDPDSLILTESAINLLPDGSWLAISRQRTGNQNYTFSSSKDGKQWTSNAYMKPVTNGTNSKPTFDQFHGIYYLGWQESTMMNGVHRSVFNIEVSEDGIHWERKYRFETEKSFQYPNFREKDGTIYLTVTQGDYSEDRKERIVFGRLEELSAVLQD